MVTRSEQIKSVFGIGAGRYDTRDYPFWGDRFTAYRRGTASDYRKAREAYIKKYGIKSWREDIKPAITGNRLNIFRVKPTMRRMFFVNRLAWSSENRIRESGKLGKILRGFK